MTTRFLLLLPLLFLAVSFPSRATLIYSGVQNVPIPFDLPAGFEGVYLQFPSGTPAGALPGSWSTAPWINPFVGGVAIGNSPLLRPVITGADQILNLAVGDVIDSTSNFVPGESGSFTHIGPAANQFQLGTPGIIGIIFETTVGGPDYYGWVRITARNTGPGSIVDWAYESTPGVGVLAGAIPEPSTALYGLALGAVSVWRRRVHVGPAQ